MSYMYCTVQQYSTVHTVIHFTDELDCMYALTLQSSIIQILSRVLLILRPNHRECGYLIRDTVVEKHRAAFVIQSDDKYFSACITCSQCIIMRWLRVSTLRAPFLFSLLFFIFLFWRLPQWESSIPRPWRWIEDSWTSGCFCAVHELSLWSASD